MPVFSHDYPILCIFTRQDNPKNNNGLRNCRYDLPN